ncbi:MAG: hypothetical protein K8W52_37045 [Deltaproteobacteria bacterium]|nr:hypothetical protein [Deltaproteobacteria bacterium]
MSLPVDQAASALRDERLADPGAHLKPKGRDELRAEIARWDAEGLRARVLVVDPGDDLDGLLGVFDALHLDPHADLVLVFDTHAWVARGWGLTEREIARALELARPGTRTVFAAQLIAALDQLAASARAQGASAAPDDSLAWPIIGGIGLALTMGLTALAIRRRNQVARAGAAAQAEVRASAERAYSEVMLACEELGGDPQATELQLRAAELRRRLDAITGHDRVALGKIHQLENELAALRSTTLQKEHA